MSAVEYNSLLFEISERLDELDVGRKLMVMCRGKVAPRNEGDLQHVFSLFVELEQNGFLGPDKLEVLKDMLKGLKEWTLFGNVKQFDAKRKEYIALLEKIILVLDELDCLDQLTAICSKWIPEERHGIIESVRTLFTELENSESLEINRLEILKEILTKMEKTDLLQEVVKFEQRRNQEDEFEWRKAQAAAIASSASSNLAGVLNIKTVFKVAAGGVFIASAFQLLKRGCTYDQFVTAINTCVLPAGVKLIQIAEGSVNLKVQAEDVSALDTLWSLYTDGTLRQSLQALFITDEMRELAGGEQVEGIVTIDQQEYEKARRELITEARASERLDLQTEEWQEKLTYIQSYLEQSKDIDSQSVSTETSDSGMPGSDVAPSELGTDEPSDSVSYLWVKDLSKVVTAELACRLEVEPTAVKRFQQSFGLDANKLHPDWLKKISELFPDTPVKVLRDVFKELQLYDLVDLLEKRKPRALRPVFPLKELRKAVNSIDRPVQVYSKAKVLIIDDSGGATASDVAQRIGSFFKVLNSQNEVTTLTVKGRDELQKLTERKYMGDRIDRNELDREEILQKLLEKKIPYSQKEKCDVRKFERNPLTVGFRVQGRRKERFARNASDEMLSIFYKEEPTMRKDLQHVKEKRQQWTEEKKPKIEREINQKEEELRGEYETLQKAVSIVMDSWICNANGKGEESILYIVLEDSEERYSLFGGNELQMMIHRCLSESLALVPGAKIWITPKRGLNAQLAPIPHETLSVYYHSSDRARDVTLATLLELLNKRWQTLDLVSMMQELRRTLAIKQTPLYDLISERQSFYYTRHNLRIHDRLSHLPMLKKIE